MCQFLFSTIDYIDQKVGFKTVAPAAASQWSEEAIELGLGKSIQAQS